MWTDEKSWLELWLDVPYPERGANLHLSGEGAERDQEKESGHDVVL